MELNVDALAEKIAPTVKPEEGKLTKAVEQQTARLPSMTWLWMALGSAALSIGFATAKDRKGAANIFGLWVPSLLLIGVYNKLVKMEQKSSLLSRLH